MERTLFESWNDAQRNALRAAELRLEDLVDCVLGAPLTTLQADAEKLHCDPETKYRLAHLIRNSPTKSELMSSAQTQQATGNIVFVPLHHEFGEPRDDEAIAFQQQIGAFILQRGDRQGDVLMLEGLAAGPVNPSRMVKQLSEIDRMEGMRQQVRSVYEERVEGLQRGHSLFRLALTHTFHVAGLEQLWLCQTCQVALEIEELQPTGMSIPIAYHLVELRNRVALNRAVDRILETSKRPIIAMGALHAFGLSKAANKAGLTCEMWLHGSLPPYVSATLRQNARHLSTQP